jgi:hypothetical protein
VAIYFVSRTGNGSAPTTDPGTSGTWTGAYATYGAAVTAATTAGDSILISDEHYEDLSTDTTYTYGATNLKIIVVDHQNTATASAMDYTNSWIGHKTSNRSIVHVATSEKIYFYGVCFSVSGSDALSLRGDDGHIEIENSILRVGSQSMPIGGGDQQTFVRLKNTSVIFISNASPSILLSGNLEMEGGSITCEGTVPTDLIKSSVVDPSGTNAKFNGVDLSAISTNLVGDCTVAATRVSFTNCKLNESVNVLNTQTVTNRASAEVELFNCSSGDTHYHFAHYNMLGSTVMETGIYANDGALYDGTNHVTWKIVSSGEATFYHPYVSPWMEQYHSGTSAITPSLEIVRSGSATAYQNDEVWGEFSYQGATGFPLAKFADDRMAVLGTPANQDTGALGAGDWTGENATSWFGKLVSPSITPAEIGMLRARVCVGEPTTTVYVDPTIRT